MVWDLGLTQGRSSCTSMVSVNTGHRFDNADMRSTRQRGLASPTMKGSLCMSLRRETIT